MSDAIRVRRRVALPLRGDPARPVNLVSFDANVVLGHRADARSYAGAAGMVRALGHARIRLLSANPDKRAQLQAHGVTVVEMKPLRVPAGPHNAHYLAAKARWFGAFEQGLSPATDTRRVDGIEQRA